MDIFKIDTNEMGNFSKGFDEDIIEFNRIIDNMNSIVETLKTGWSGPDAERFINNFREYIDALNKKKEKMFGFNGAIGHYTNFYDDRYNMFDEAIDTRRYYE